MNICSTKLKAKGIRPVNDHKGGMSFPFLVPTAACFTVDQILLLWVVIFCWRCTLDRKHVVEGEGKGREGEGERFRYLVGEFFCPMLLGGG